MTHADIVKVFTYHQLTDEQEADLVELHLAAQTLATTIYKVVSARNQSADAHHASGAGFMWQLARQSIELQPRAGESRISMVH